LRFEGLPPGVYQIRVSGPLPSERFATKLVIGRTDTRQTTITVEPFTVSGQIMLGKTQLGTGAIVLRHREFHFRVGLEVAADGTFKGPMWQRGAFSYSVRGLALATEYANSLEVRGPSRLSIDIPDGRIKGIVRDAKSGLPVEGALVLLQTKTSTREDHVKLATGPEGRFDFNGMSYGHHTIRISSTSHLEPAPIVFTLDAQARLRELDVRLDSGHAVAIIVIDNDNDPVANAKVFAVSDSKLCSRSVTDEDGRSSIPVPEGEAATLFVVAPERPFGVLRVARGVEKGRLQVHLPPTSSSLMIRALTLDGKPMPPFNLLMRFNGELVPPVVADELQALQGLRLMTGTDSEACLRNIPSGSYEFWPYRSASEVELIVAAGATLLAPIQVNVRVGENKIAVKFAKR